MRNSRQHTQTIDSILHVPETFPSLPFNEEVMKPGQNMELAEQQQKACPLFVISHFVLAVLTWPCFNKPLDLLVQ